MFRYLRGVWDQYKFTFLKLCIALIFVFLFLQYNTLGNRSSAHYLYLQIKNGKIGELCIAPSSNMFADNRGIYIVIDKTKMYLSEDWAYVKPKENLYIAIVMGGYQPYKKVYEIDGYHANMLLQQKDGEGCRSFYNPNRNNLVK